MAVSPPKPFIREDPSRPLVQVTFLGGAGEVGRLTTLVEVAGLRLLFDYGFTASKPISYPERAPPVDAIFVTHCHLDHSGMVPEAMRRHQAPVYTTSLTSEISELLCLDSIRIAKNDGHPFPYEEGDVENAYRTTEDVSFGGEVELVGASVRAHSAGHIPGAAMYELKTERSTLFTGDISTLASRLVNGARPVQCRNLLVEGTYAGREHPNRHELELELLDRIDDIVYRGGHVVLPAFAVGRTQEVLLMLEGSGHEVYLDGMGKTVNQIYMDNGAFLRSAGALHSADEGVRYVKSESGRSRAKEADVIVTTSGMLEGGPVGQYLREFARDPRSAVFLTGYQVEGTAGRRLMDDHVIDIDGATVPVECEVEYFDFSSHAGHSDLVDFIKRCSPENVVVMHSDDPKALAFDPELEGFEFVLPENGKTFKLPD